MAANPWTAARRHLSRSDDTLASIIARVGPCTLKPGGEPFAVLVGSVIAQLISTAAARTILARLHALVGDAGVTPASITALPEDRLRGVGLSGAKAASIRELAARAADGRLPLSGLAALGEDEIAAALTAVRGIGPWTAMMFLIFCLGKPDVLPVGDFGLRAGVRDLYGLEALPGAKDLRELTEPWRPWRSVGTWYIWRGRGPVPQSE
ncbi:MAG: DNA-3-methyladenine glycosylase family protein [Gemmataceae bacterium]